MKWGFSDDGEPSGTAGKPILAQLTGSNVGEITAVVTRYYGGIRLGTGGLVKAYGGGVQQALAQLITQEKVMTAIVTLCCDYNQVSLVESLLNEHGGVQLTADYQTQVSMALELDQREVSAFCAKLVNRSGGRIQPVTAD